MNYTLNFIKGCPFINDGQGLFLIDTGAPISISKTKKINFSGTVYPCPASYSIMNTDVLDEWFDTTITGVLGMNILSQSSIAIDYKEKVLVTDYTGPLGTEAGELCGLYLSIHRFTLDGTTSPIVLDTGAHISYLRPEYFEGHEVKDTIYDVTWGEPGTRIRTNLYDVECDFLNKKWTMRCGEIPPRYQMHIQSTPLAGVAGKDFFEQFQVVIRNGKLYFTPFE